MSAFGDADDTGKLRGQSAAVDFILLPPEDARAMLIKYHAKMVKQNLAISTINRRLATMRAWVRFAHNEMLTGLSPDQLIGELVTDAELRENFF